MLRNSKNISSIKGVQKLQEWTKQSLRDKPFSTLKGKIWTETPSTVSFQKIYTKLSYAKKSREPYGPVAENLGDITEILEEQEFNQLSSIRILIQGKLNSSYVILVYFSHIFYFLTLL